jgi:crotonobetainyl-CoA:carnitine CoA-transferase CaiB-like acyl-CoA transferase
MLGEPDVHQEQRQSGPLSGLRVVDVTAGLAGAYGARLLADLGAHIIRLADTRSLARWLNPSRRIADWDPGLHRVINAGKDTLALDLQTPQGLQDIRDLLRDARLLIEDVGMLDGPNPLMPWRNLHPLNPKLTALSVSPFGASGPYASYPASDLTLWAWSGMAWTTPGIPDTPRDLPNEPPLAPTGIAIPSLIGGVVTAVSALAALLGNWKAGQGNRVEVSELEAVAALNYHPLAQYEYLRRLWARGPNIIARQPNCYIPCKDGWLVLVAMSPQHWQEFVAAMGNPEWARSEVFADGPMRAANWDALEPLILEWTMAHTGREITEELQRRGLPVYSSASLQDALSSPQVEARRFLRHTMDNQGRNIPFPGLPFILSDFPRESAAANGAARGPYPSEVAVGVAGAVGTPPPPAGASPRAKEVEASAALPLVGVRIIDFGQYIAVPFAARWLAALGADVIQVESRLNPFDYRNVPPFADGQPGLDRAAGYNVLNAGKRSVSLNLRTEQGRDLARRLALMSDVLMENYSTGLMERWGLGYRGLAEENPRLIYASVAAFGRTGPLKDYGGLHSIVNAFSGLADVTGYTGGHPRLLGSYFPDVVSAAYATLATLSALHHREVTGRGQHIDLAMTEALMTLLPGPALALATGSYRPKRNGSRHPFHAPHNVYPAKGDDQWVAVAVRTEEEWQALTKALGRDGISSDPRFQTMESRKRNESALDKAIAGWTKRRTKHEAAGALLRGGVPAAPVLDPQELANDPHLNDRGFIAPTDHPEVGARKAAGIPWRVDGEIAGRRRAAPRVNEHTQAILRDLLGLSTRVIKSLTEQGVLT